MATVVSGTLGKSQAATNANWLVNAAFLQEMKDSNPNLWHQFHHLRTLCQLEPEDCETPQATIKAFAECLNDLRDLLALQFSLEESYGLIASPDVKSSTPTDYPGANQTPEELSLRASAHERCQMVENVITEHRSLYLQIVDHVEQAEELQYRGCEANCLKTFAEQVERYCQNFTAHERLENELIRLHGSFSAIPPQAAGGVGRPTQDHYGDQSHVR